MAAEYKSGQGDKTVRYLPGKNLVCKVVSKVHKFPAGYFVTTVNGGEHGFLQTTAELRVDAEVIGQFVCWAARGGRYILLTLVTELPK
jgi:hypothetical protein